MKSKQASHPKPSAAGERRSPQRSASAPDAAVKPFRGRAVVVTGGATGIGLATAAAFAAAGAKVTILDRDRAAGVRALRELRRLNPTADLRVLDLGDAAAVRGTADLFRGPHGADILVNNAAMPGRTAPFTELKPHDWEAVIRVNLLGHYLLSHLAAKHLLKRRATGSIINVLTIQTTIPVPGFTAYIASKGALEALTRAMAVDLAPHGIRVNGIQVGTVLTEAFRRVAPAAVRREAARAKVDIGVIMDRCSATLLGRMGRPEEIAKVALFLASDDASYLTGTIIRADGGRVLSRKIEQLV